MKLLPMKYIVRENGLSALDSLFSPPSDYKRNVSEPEVGESEMIYEYHKTTPANVS